MKTAVFIMSCDKTRDVLLHFVEAFNKFWDNNRLPVYLGTNNEPTPSNFNNSILLPVPKSNWKQETLEQLSLLQHIDPSLTHVIILLDDFILNQNVENDRLTNMLDSGQLRNIKYLRLKRLEEGIFKKIIQCIFVESDFLNEKIFKIRKSHPYFTSLQIAIWDINYLKSCITNCKNIWAFETQKNSQIEHYSVLHNIFHYQHIVEKGKWESYAPMYCKKHINFFNSGNREFRSLNLSHKLKNRIKKIKFLIFGYWFTNFE